MRGRLKRGPGTFVGVENVQHPECGRAPSGFHTTGHLRGVQGSTLDTSHGSLDAVFVYQTSIKVIKKWEK